MERRYLIPVVLIALTLIASACAPQAGSAAAAPAATSAYSVPATLAAPASTQSSAAAMPSGPAHIALGKGGQFSSFLVDDKGMSLYLYTKDSPNTSNCYDKCATAWPPLLTSGAPVGGDGLDASKFGTTTRTDGTMQVTYNGWPLYYFAKDKAPGDVTGQNVGKVWFLLGPSGDAIK
jgi:predicted lipoprotein with Yx(FWY)xxD motif